MRLSDLEPRWYEVSGVRAGVTFLCPRCRDGRLAVPFADPTAGANWQRVGESFDDLTLTPSVASHHVRGGLGSDTGEPRTECDWHGWVRNGAVVE